MIEQSLGYTKNISTVYWEPTSTTVLIKAAWLKYFLKHSRLPVTVSSCPHGTDSSKPSVIQDGDIRVEKKNS